MKDCQYRKPDGYCGLVEIYRQESGDMRIPDKLCCADKCGGKEESK